jgi:hypothetical protein
MRRFFFLNFKENPAIAPSLISYNFKNLFFLSYNDFEKQIFDLMYTHHWSWDTVIDLPTDRRLRYINHIGDIIKAKNEQEEKALEQVKNLKRNSSPAQPPINIPM